MTAPAMIPALLDLDVADIGVGAEDILEAAGATTYMVVTTVVIDRPVVCMYDSRNS